MIQTELALWWENITLPPRLHQDYPLTYRVNPASVRPVRNGEYTCEAYRVDTGREVKNWNTLDALGRIVMERRTNNEVLAPMEHIQGR